jgi:hypothetical protein
MEHGSLLGDVARFPEGVAEGPVQIQEARRVSRHRDFFYESQSDRRHASGFDFSGEQSHGPRADGSGGHQERQINARLADASRDFFDCRHETPGTAHQAETVVLLGQTPDDPLCFELPESLDRKHKVDVPERVCPVVGLV